MLRDLEAEICLFCGGSRETRLGEADALLFIDSCLISCWNQSHDERDLKSVRIKGRTQEDAAERCVCV